VVNRIVRLWQTGSAPVHVRASASHDPAALETEESALKKDIHPEYGPTTVTCSACSTTFDTRSTAKNGVIRVETCSACHPFYTGKQRILDTGGRVARFQQRYGKKAAAPEKADAPAGE
jgi:large subunit ribosomal protein L31